MADNDKGISFELSDAQLEALKLIGGNRKVHVIAEVKDGKLQINNLGFDSANQAFAACNAGTGLTPKS